MAGTIDESDSLIDGSDGGADFGSMYAAKASPMEDTQTPRFTPPGLVTNGSVGSSGKPLLQVTKVSSVSSSSLLTDDTFYDNDVAHRLSLSDSESEDEPTTLAGKLMHWFTMPLQILFKCTCPPAGEGPVTALSLHSFAGHTAVLPLNPCTFAACRALYDFKIGRNL